MEAVIFLMLIIFSGSLVNSTFGFGFAMVSMPLLSLFFDLDIIGPLIPLLFLSGSSIIVYRSWKLIQFKNTITLIIAALLFIPVGVYVGKYGNSFAIKTLLGISIIVFAVYNLILPKLKKRDSKGRVSIKSKLDKLAILCGMCSGIFGGAFNIIGPPVVIYGSVKKWTPETFRATVQFCLLTFTIIIISSHFSMGSYDDLKILYYFIFAFPSMFFAIPIGKKINKGIKSPEDFNKYVYLLMLASGSILILNAH